MRSPSQVSVESDFPEYKSCLVKNEPLAIITHKRRIIVLTIIVSVAFLCSNIARQTLFSSTPEYLEKYIETESHCNSGQALNLDAPKEV